MGDLRNLNRAVQSAEFPSHEWAAAVREWVDAVTERMEPASEGAKVEETPDRSTFPACKECGEYSYRCTCSEKVECQNCRRPVQSEREHWATLDAAGGEGFYCKPAQPEPAAPVGEMPEAVHHAWLFLDVIGQRDRFAREAAVKLRDWWRTHAAQPKVAMSPDLEDLLDSIMSFADVDPDTQVKQIWRRKVAAVRAQAAGVKLPKVRELIEGMARMYRGLDGERIAVAALAELDAVEKG